MHRFVRIGIRAASALGLIIGLTWSAIPMSTIGAHLANAA
jgi:hypothetical protein